MRSRNLKSTILPIDSDTQIRFSYIPKGSFLMGSPDSDELARANEKPQYRVEVSGFWLGKFPVSNLEWDAVMGASLNKSGGPSSPVVNVSLSQAFNFCGLLSSITKESVRLPSESEWEYACRAGSQKKYAFGDHLDPKVVNFGATEGPWDVGSGGVPNDFGVYDMHGCVWEWCADYWHPDYTGAPVDGSSWQTGGDQSYVVQRGGAWNSEARSCRSANRVGDIATNNANIVGLRVAFS